MELTLTQLLISAFPSLLMGVATFGWLHDATRPPSCRADRVELILGCGLLNVAAFVAWNVLLGPRAALQTWLLHAAAAVTLNLLLALARLLNGRHLLLRPIAPVAGYALAAGLTALWTLPSQGF